jgi:hypothetical protein
MQKVRILITDTTKCCPVFMVASGKHKKGQKMIVEVKSKAVSSSISSRRRGSGNTAIGLLKSIDL